MLFAALGRAQHSHAGGGPIAGTLGVAAPFLIGWFAAAILLGAYSEAAFSTRASQAVYITRAWIVGGSIALAIRSVLEHGIVPLGFIVVALTFNLVVLLGWRLAITSFLAHR